MKSLEDKLVIITGAASGIGRELAKLFAERRSRLALIDIDSDGLNELCTELRSKTDCLAGDFDITNEAKYARFIEKLTESNTPDLLINNAGFALGRMSLEKVSSEQFKRIFDINYWSVVNGIRLVLPHLKKRPEAGIVNLSSLFGLTGIAYQTPYCSTKFAVRGLSEALRMELRLTAPHIFVSAVFPGGVKTNIAKNAEWPDSISKEEKEARIANFEKLFRTSAADAAQQIIRGIEKKKARILVGADARFLDKLLRIWPVTVSNLVARRMRKFDQLN